MFIAELFTIAKLCKHPRCPTTDKWIKKMYLYAMEFYSAGKLMELKNILLVKLVRFRKPVAACFFSYVDYRPNINTSNNMKKGHTKGRSLMRGGGEKKEVKNVSMVVILSLQE
jgi:hypothetical protein